MITEERGGSGEENIFVAVEEGGAPLLYCNAEASYRVAEEGQPSYRGLAKLPIKMIRVLDEAPKPVYNCQTLVHIAGIPFPALLDTGATTSSIPEELFEKIFNKTMQLLSDGHCEEDAVTFPIRGVEDFSKDARRIEGLAKDRPILVTHAVVVRMMLVPIDANPP